MSIDTNANVSVVLDRRYKGFPPAAAPCRLEDIAARGWNILAGDLSFPIAVLKESALRHNVAWMEEFCRARNVTIAPHGKTTMAPELYRRQMAAGAWGMSFATVHQMGAGVESGVKRILIPNQIISDADLDGLSAFLSADPQLRVWFLVDSIAQIERIEDWRQRRENTARFDCLLEIGIMGKRTGCRTFDDALAVAARVHASPALRLGGVECYEGGLAQGDSTHDAPAVAALMQRVVAVAQACDQNGYFTGDSILLTAGGSALFDLVTDGLMLDTLAATLSKPVLGILRSGCYITHDHGSYMRLVHKVEERIGAADSLRPALEVWAMVQSCPEPGLAILTCGKRDISYDLELPFALFHHARGAARPTTVPEGWRISELNDQHAYLRYPAEQSGPAVGDLIGMGISHPCTTFDKWLWMPVVDDAYTVCDAITTRF